MTNFMKAVIERTTLAICAKLRVIMLYSSFRCAPNQVRHMTARPTAHLGLGRLFLTRVEQNLSNRESGQARREKVLFYMFIGKHVIE